MNNKISAFLQSRIDARDFPSAVYLVAQKDEIVFRDALGFAVAEPEKIRANLDTIYDLASLTKPLVTGLSCAKLIEKGEINLNDKLSRYLTEFDNNEKRGITIENLLTHVSGFPAWKPFYLTGGEGKTESVLAQIVAEPLAYPTNSKVVYSDFNFITLGFLLEKIHGKSLDKIAEQEIFTHLNLQNTFFNPPENLKRKIAASESGNFYERETAEQQNSDVEKNISIEKEKFRTPHSAFRNELIWGAVHDGNACFLGGVSGHAGLFSNVFETFQIARQFLANQTKLLKPETCRLFRTNFTPALSEARSIAFQLAATEDSTASNALSKDSFGHLGFTGTSLWIEPETERIFILLTNRTHARTLPFVNINSTRREFHGLAAELLNRR